METGTFEALSWALQLGATLLALTAHTTPEGGLLLEHPTGEAAEFDPATALAEMLGPGGEGCGGSPGAHGALPVILHYIILYNIT